MDFVIALDSATAGDHPSWPGQPETALWDVPAIAANQKVMADAGIVTMQTLHALRRRIELFSILCAKGKTRSDLREDLRDLAHM
jgi:arsenate reductase